MTGALALGLVACTRVVEGAPPSTSAAAASTADGWQGAAAEPIGGEAPPPRGRPRLSQTVTLGQGTEASYSPSSPAPSPQAAGQNVVVNQNVIVQSGAGYPGYGAYGGYYGYGGSGRGVARPDVRGGATGRAGGPSNWSTTGWEGPSRTAAPGQTPGVGGNWSPAPSYGPSQMK